MHSRGRWMDSVFIERLWRLLKHEDVYLKGYADGREAHGGSAEWFGFYKHRPHQALGSRTPMAARREGISAGLPKIAADMTLRLDNANALLTCPQQQQHQHRRATAGRPGAVSRSVKISCHQIWPVSHDSRSQ
jgi:putative transposase